MRILSAHDINNHFNIPFKRATSVPEQCSNFCRNAQLECQQNPLSPALCGTGSNFLDQYNFCQSCIDDNSNNPDLIKAHLAVRFMKCVGYCRLQAADAPSSKAQTGSPAITGQDEDPFTTATAKASSTSSSTVQTMALTSASLDKGERTMITSTLPATTKPPSPPTNNPTLPIPSTSTPQSLSTLPSSSSSSLAPTSTSLITLNPTQTLATSTPSLTSPADNTSSTSQSSAAASTSSARTAPWVWAIVGITITVVLLLSGGSFFVFYKRGRSKRGRQKGMVELKETTMNGFLDGWGNAGSTCRTGARTGMRTGDEVEMDTACNVTELGDSGSGRGRGVGGLTTASGNVPVELSSANGFAELPTEFNQRREEIG